ncbi:MAG: hypothetical protein IJU66_06845 [Oscillospiraceae bacterium]|nr:hypothetical protein [Oscillospiraceae bacterium]
MIAPQSRQARRVNRLQNLAIVFLALSAVLLFANLPLFGSLSDRSLLALARDRLRQENIVAAPNAEEAPVLTLPVRIVYTNNFARLASESLTTLSDEFELAGTYLSEALGSAGSVSPVRETAFLSALRSEGLYFDFSTPIPSDLLSRLFGISVSELAPKSVRRALLSPSSEGDAVLYVQSGESRCYRFSTAVRSSALLDFLASRSGDSTEFAFMLGAAYGELSPYTLVINDPPPRGVLTAVNAVSGNEESLLRRAGFSAHADNRFTESSGTVIVREISSTLYLRPNGVVDYQGGGAAADSPFFVPAALVGMPNAAEAAIAAQRMAVTLLHDILGGSELCLSGIESLGRRYEITFDLMVNGTPVRFSDGSHTAVFTIDGQSITAFSLRPRRYTLTAEPTLLLPFSQAAAIARVYQDSELGVVYVDAGGETVQPAWIADQKNDGNS